jgi:Ni/Fe-hydrogenase 1 B-type cytochrome subunit
MATAVNELNDVPDLRFGRKYVWEFPVRLTHWVNAMAIPVLVLTGLLIARPQLSTVGEPFRNFWMGRIREIHFIASYILTISILLRTYWFFVGNNYARSGFPTVWRRSWWTAFRQQAIEYTRPGRGHAYLGHNPLAGASYFAFLVMACFEILTGFALYSQVNPGGFWNRLCGWIIPLLGGPFQTQMWHHLAAWGFVVFTVFHLYIVIYKPRVWGNGLVEGMFSGLKFYLKGDVDSDTWLS